MKKLKYIKRIFESNDSVDIISISGDTVELVRPDGKTVKVSFEEDGEWEDFIDPPYVKAVSMSGQDDKYIYSTSGSTVTGEPAELDDDPEIEFELLSEFKEREQRMLDRQAESIKRWKQELKDKKDKEEREIARLGISRAEYEFRKFVKSELDKANRNSVSQKGNIEEYAIVKTRYKDNSYDGYWSNDYFKVSLQGMTIDEFRSTLITFEDLGLFEASDAIIEGIPEGHEVSEIFSSNSDHQFATWDSKSFTIKGEIDYIKRLPFGSSLHKLVLAISSK